MKKLLLSVIAVLSVQSGAMASEPDATTRIYQTTVQAARSFETLEAQGVRFPEPEAYGPMTCAVQAMDLYEPWVMCKLGDGAKVTAWARLYRPTEVWVTSDEVQTFMITEVNGTGAIQTRLPHNVDQGTLEYIQRTY